MFSQWEFMIEQWVSLVQTVLSNVYQCQEKCIFLYEKYFILVLIREVTCTIETLTHTHNIT